MLAHVLTLFLLLGLSVTAWARDIQTRVSAETITTQDVLTFTIEAAGDVRSVLPPHTEDFDIVGRSTQTSMSFINGHMSRTLTASFQLAPTRAGQLTLGPAQVVLNTGRTLETDSYKITVRDTGAPRGATPQLPPSTGMTSPPASMPPIPTPKTAPPSSRNLRSPAAKEFGDYPPLGPLGSDQLTTKDDHRFDPQKPFILPFVSKTSVVVGEPFVVEYMYYSPVRGLGFDAYDLNEPAFKDAWFKDITDARFASSPRVTNVQIGGAIYSTQLVRSYLVVPLKSGAFEVPPISLTVEGRTFSRTTKPSLAASPSMQVDILDVPEEARPSAKAQSVGRYHFRASVSPEEAQVGDTFQLHIEVNGIGVPSQIHLPDVTLPETLRAFAPTESSNSTESTTGWVESRVRRTLSFQATEEGDYVIPPITFHWYDPWQAEWKSRQSEALTFRVQGINPNIEIEAPDTDDNQPLRVSWVLGLPTGDEIPDDIGLTARLRRNSEPWIGSPLYIALLLFPLLCVLIIQGTQWFRRRRTASASTRRYQKAGPAALRELQALEYRDAQSFSLLDRSVRNYLRAREVPNAVGATLDELRRALSDTRGGASADALLPQLEALQLARFGGADAAQFQTLRRALIDWVKTDLESAP